MHPTGLVGDRVGVAPGLAPVGAALNDSAPPFGGLVNAERTAQVLIFASVGSMATMLS